MEHYKLHKDYISDRLSFYRTEHCVERYVEVFTKEGFEAAFKLSKEEGRKLFILGNGSNLIFRKRAVKSVLVRNRMKPELTSVTELNDTFWLSASLSIMKALKFCYDDSRDSFYYLASVPATIGGAIAMNAGRGRGSGLSIYDFIQEITYFDPSSDYPMKSIAAKDALIGYRQTIFTGASSRFIIGATFRFPHANLSGNPIKERMEWSKRHQDYSGPNCGTVFKRCRGKIMPFLKGVGDADTHFSKNCSNWIINRSKDPKKLLRLISLVRVLSAITLKRPELENIIVD
jgi:UDP-N-acetylmuramate dehydrogenase